VLPQFNNYLRYIPLDTQVRKRRVAAQNKDLIAFGSTVNRMA